MVEVFLTHFHERTETLRSRENFKNGKLNTRDLVGHVTRLGPSGHLCYMSLTSRQVEIDFLGVNVRIQPKMPTKCQDKPF